MSKAHRMSLATLTKYGSAILLAWQLAGHANTALIEHLDKSFASKADFKALEEKLDSVLERLPERPAPAAPRRR